MRESGKLLVEFIEANTKPNEGSLGSQKKNPQIS
jgi:hypothetical protein